MVKRTYANQIDPIEVSVAIERLLVGNYPATWGGDRIDLSAIPSGFYDLGAVVEDSPSIKGSTELYTLETGLPKVVQFESKMRLTGSISATLHSNSWRKAQYMFSNYSPTANAAAVGTISSVHSDGLTFVMPTTPTTPLAVGQQIIVSSNSFDDPDALEVRIGSVTTGDLVYSIAADPIKDLAAGLTLGVYSKVTQYFGGKNIKYYSVLGVADFIDGVQIVHEFRKVSQNVDIEQSFKPDENGRTPLTFNAHAWDTIINTCTELVLFGHHYFPPLENLCNG